MGNLKSKKSSIKQNYAYNLIYQISTIIVPLITLPYVSRIFHASGIGIYSYTLSIVTYFSMFSVLGIAVYGQLEIAKFRDNIEKRSKIFLEIIYTRIILGFIIMLLYSLLIIFSKEYKMMYIIMSFNILGSLADISWYFQGMEQFKPIALKNTFIKIFGAILIMTIIKRESQIYLYAAILQGTYFLGNASLWPNLKNSIVKTNIDKNSVINHLKKSFIYFIPSFATSIYTVLDKSMIGWLSTSNAQNGYYEQAHKIEQVLVTLVTSLGTVTMPRIAYLQQEKKNEKIKEIVNNAIEFVCFLSFPIFIGIISISNRLIPFFLGNGYDECIKLLNVFSLLIV